MCDITKPGPGAFIPLWKCETLAAVSATLTTVEHTTCAPSNLGSKRNSYSWIASLYDKVLSSKNTEFCIL